MERSTLDADGPRLPAHGHCLTEAGHFALQRDDKARSGAPQYEDFLVHEQWVAQPWEKPPDHRQKPARGHERYAGSESGYPLLRTSAE